ncbi:MAG: peptidylprolyl isomerase [Chitinophagaceae bacterium]
MKKLFFSIAILTASFSFSQTLFTFGNKVVTKQDFLAAFNKNPSATADKKTALDEYRNLYINFKLKVQSALDEKLNETKSFKAESDNFKRQIADNIINEEADAKSLLKEAFERSQKDIDISQIFVANNADSAAARIEIYKAYTDLKAGKKFDETLEKYCNDESVKKAKGMIGYITVFSLPYQIENVVYALKPQQFSAPYRSAYGWHIFKNVSERTAVGKRRMSQILLSYPPDATQAEKEKVDKTAAEVYARVKRGENFGMLAQDFSNDYSTANNKGDMGEVGLGKFNRAFEEQIFALKNNGDISEMIKTDYGIHILKLVEILPITTNPDDAIYQASLKVKLDNSDRLAIAKKNLISKWKTLTGFRKAFFNETAAWAFIDSSIQEKSTDDLVAFANDSTLLFSYKKQNVKLFDFIQYVKNVRYSGTETGNKTYPELISMFEDVSCSEYYKNHLEDYSKSLQAQLKEFDEANLLFAAMDKHVWSKAAEDSAGLKTYFDANKTKYNWQPGIAAVSISANSKTLALELFDKIKANPQDWKKIVGDEGAKAVSDSGRYENDQLPIKSAIEKKVGFFSTPEKNGSDESYSFIFITGVFDKVEPRTFEEARGLVMNDYQQQLEKQWLDGLKKKYPIKVNEEVWKTIK